MGVSASPQRKVTAQKSKEGRRRLGLGGRKWVWKMKFGITWKAIKRVVATSTKQYRLHLTCSSAMDKNEFSFNQNHRHKSIDHHKHNEMMEKYPSSRRPKPLASLLRLPQRASDFIDYGDHMTPTLSPKENISNQWREVHGLHNWSGLIDPLHPWLRREIVKYGEFAQATYDAFDFDPLSEYRGSCRYNKNRIFEELNLTKNGYKVTKYIYAMSHVDVPSWFENTDFSEIWSKDSNWMGFVAVSTDEESERIGRRDVVVAWRGTIAPSEWFTNLKTKLEEIEEPDVKVQLGFLTIYKSKCQFTRYNKSSASEQVMDEIRRLNHLYKQKKEQISLTITGHSLGGALALLTAHEAATDDPNLSIAVFSFGAPRVGNLAFKERLNGLKIKTLRLVVSQDLVPKLPGLLFNHIFKTLNVITQKLNFIYRHVGTQLKLDILNSPYLKRESDLQGSHNLEIYLHLLDGYQRRRGKFRWNARRDVALVNKTSDMLIEELRIPEFWYQLPHKGLVLNKHGRWVKPGRRPEDVPSPLPHSQFR